MADTAFRWLDARHVTQRADPRNAFDAFLDAPDGHLDAQEMIDRMIGVVPADTGKFRNVVPDESLAEIVPNTQRRRSLVGWSTQVRVTPWVFFGGLPGRWTRTASPSIRRSAVHSGRPRDVGRQRSGVRSRRRGHPRDQGRRGSQLQEHGRNAARATRRASQSAVHSRESLTTIIARLMAVWANFLSRRRARHPHFGHARCLDDTEGAT